MYKCLLFLSAVSALLVSAVSCSVKDQKTKVKEEDSLRTIRPLLVTDSVRHDSDDPAVWINRQDKSKSLILGTDKGGDTGDGAIYVFDLNGKEVKDKTVHGIKRPNNIDIAYDFNINGKLTDIAVLTERLTNSIRVFSLPEMKPLDNGGIPVFESDTARAPMGVALYTDANKNTFAIVSRKNGISGEYLWQYRLEASNGFITGKVVRKFGNYSGKHEIESVAVDNELGYVYYSDEGAGVRKYYAHPDSTNTELAFFGQIGFTDNHEGISIYKKSGTKGYILVSDQQANQFMVFSRDGSLSNPHDHQLIKVIKASTRESDGNDATSDALPGFPKGLFVAMSNDRTFQVYRWEDFGLE
ncbi:phytase [Chryseosolibacter indicus]|uniref:Phytase n=1 Tax=Chryseosolibacter indicus TaxID=2782351 RepID=A0ABS5VUP3_9BACT|nr:phytase [Chryseosolibacter indicus]MBT1704609.1 phytase [Chryseosolibacter indicus]